MKVLNAKENGDVLKEASDEVKITMDLKKFLREYLLPTMYKELANGISAIEVGLPVRAFIIDVPIIYSINGR